MDSAGKGKDSGIQREEGGTTGGGTSKRDRPASSSSEEEDHVKDEVEIEEDPIEFTEVRRQQGGRRGARTRFAPRRAVGRYRDRSRHTRNPPAPTSSAEQAPPQQEVNPGSTCAAQGPDQTVGSTSQPGANPTTASRPRGRYRASRIRASNAPPYRSYDDEEEKTVHRRQRRN